MNLPANALASWMRTCALVMGGLGLFILLSGGLTWWKVALAVLLLACPAMAFWVGWKYGRNGEQSTGSAEEIHHGS